MITIAPTGSNLRTQRYLHTLSTVQATKSLNSLTDDCCWCSCVSEIPVFAYLTDVSDNEKNDWSSFIWKLPSNATAVLTLTNLDTETDYVINSTTYGEFYAVDALKNNVLGVIIEWHKVANVIGFGNYQLNLTVTSAALTEILNKDYPRYRLMPYTCDNAHGTVRIETYNTGYIEGGFDYRNLDFGYAPGTVPYGVLPGWGQQIRFYGKLENTAIPVQIDNIFDNKRNLNQVQTQIHNEWNLRLQFINSDVSDQIIYDNLLADYVLVSDYNANNVKDYKNIKVSLLSVETPQPFLNKTSLFNIKFVDYTQNLLKRHY